MKKNQFTFLVLLIALLNSSCTNYGKLTRRYNSINVISDTRIDTFVKVNAYVFSPESSNSPSPKSIFDLDEKAQAKLITEMSKKTTSTADLAKAINGKFSDDDKENNIFDLREISKRVVISVNNLSEYPADRIAKLNITLSMDPRLPISFLYCSKMQTEFGSIDYGKLNYSNSSGFELNAGIQAPSGSTTNNTYDGANLVSSLVKTLSATNGVNGKLSGSKTFAEEVLLKQRFVSLSANTDGRNINFLQDGIMGIDLAGNVIATVGVDLGKLANRYTTTTAYNLSNYKKDDKYNLSDSLSLKNYFFLIPEFNKDIVAKFSYDVSYRKVIKNDNTITEADDNIIIHKGTHTDTSPLITLIRKQEFSPPFWGIEYKIKDSLVHPSYLKVKQKGQSDDESGTLLFKDYQSAKDFWDWLTNSPKPITGNEIGIQKDQFKLLFPTKPKIEDVRKHLVISLYE